jgi:hypothetical protein
MFVLFVTPLVKLVMLVQDPLPENVPSVNPTMIVTTDKNVPTPPPDVSIPKPFVMETMSS